MYILGFLFIIILGAIFWYFKKNTFIFRSKNGLPLLFLIGGILILFASFIEKQFFVQKNISLTSSNIVFVLDVSKSMTALDYEEYSRLDMAKEFIKNYISSHPNNRYALTLFAGEATALLPFVSDKNIFLNTLSTANEKSLLRGGTNFIDAYTTSLERFLPGEGGGAIIFLSDFEPNISSQEKENLLSSLKNIKNQSGKSDIETYFIGLGKTAGNYMITGYGLFGEIMYHKYNGENVLTRFDKEFFEDMVEKLGGKGFVINDLSDIKKIDFTPKYAQKNDEIANIYLDTSRYFLIAVFVILVGFMILYIYFDEKGRQNI